MPSIHVEEADSARIKSSGRLISTIKAQGGPIIGTTCRKKVLSFADQTPEKIVKPSPSGLQDLKSAESHLLPRCFIHKQSSGLFQINEVTEFEKNNGKTIKLQLPKNESPDYVT